MLSQVTYHIGAAVATLAYLVIVGFLTLFLMWARAPGNEILALVLKLIAVGVAISGFIACIYLWNAKRWLVVVIPVLGLAAELLINWIGQTLLHWSIPVFFV